MANGQNPDSPDTLESPDVPPPVPQSGLEPDIPKPLKASSLKESTKFFFDLLIWLVTLVAFAAAGAKMFAGFIPPSYGAACGLILWLIVSIRAFTLFILNIPTLKVKITLDLLFRTHSVYGAGFRFKLPWESVQFEIDLQREDIVSSNGQGREETYTTSDGVELIVKWLFVIKPREEYILNYVTWTDKARMEVPKARVSTWFSNYFANKDAIHIIQHKTEIADMVAQIFGGENQISAEERRYGIKISNPQFFDADFSPGTKKAYEENFIADQQVKAAKKYQEVGVEKDKILEMVLISSGKVKKRIFDVRGLEGMKTVIAPGLFDRLFGPEGGGKGKKSK